MSAHVRHPVCDYVRNQVDNSGRRAGNMKMQLVTHGGMLLVFRGGEVDMFIADFGKLENMSVSTEDSANVAVPHGNAFVRFQTRTGESAASNSYWLLVSVVDATRVIEWLTARWMMAKFPVTELDEMPGKFAAVLQSGLVDST